MSADADVAVVGGGPAGCAAAITLARAGAHVVLVDKVRFPRDKCCGDGLTTGALRRLESLGFAPGDAASFIAVRDLVVRAPSGRTATVPLGDGQGVRAAVAERRDLDAALVALAGRSGVEVREGAGLEAIAAHGPRLECRTEDGATLRVGHMIAADGAWSRTRRLLGGAARRVESNWTAFRAYVRNVADDPARDLHVAFLPDLLPGYAWSFPLPGRRANVGVYVRRDPARRGGGLQAAWQSFVADPYLVALLGPDARFEGPARAWPIPTALDDAPSALDGRVLFCGDALGAADPFTGEGIAQALETGEAAALAIASRPADPARAYAETLAEGLGPDHALGARLSGGFARRGLAEAAVRVTGLTPQVARAVGRWLYEDYPRAIWRRPARWRDVLAPSVAPYAGGL